MRITKLTKQFHKENKARSKTMKMAMKNNPTILKRSLLPKNLRSLHIASKAESIYKGNRVSNCKRKKFRVVNVLISNARQRKFIRKSGHELKTTNTDFFARLAMKITLIALIVSSASKFTPIIARIKTMISGLDAIHARDG
jgi:hypothetical protein